MEMNHFSTVRYGWTQYAFWFSKQILLNFVLFYLLGDKELIQEVLFDAVVTAPLEAYWTSLVLNKSEWVICSA